MPWWLYERAGTVTVPRIAFPSPETRSAVDGFLKKQDASSVVTVLETLFQFTSRLIRSSVGEKIDVALRLSKAQVALKKISGVGVDYIHKCRIRHVQSSVRIVPRVARSSRIQSCSSQSSKFMKQSHFCIFRPVILGSNPAVTASPALPAT
jgi:hypothetical protein